VSGTYDPGRVEQTDTSVTGVIAALRDPNATFSRDQVARLLATAYRYGYEARVDEEERAYPPPPVRILGRWVDQVDYRRRFDAAARLPRPGDFQGRAANRSVA
jgi:hypothetical protein